MSNNPGTTEKIGITSFMATEQFVMGMMTYLNGLSKMNAQTQTTARSMTGALAGGADRTSDGLRRASESSNMLTRTFEALSVKTVALGTFIGNLADRALTNLMTKIRELVSGGIMIAARFQEMDFVLQVLAQQAGLSKDALDGFIESMREAGIRSDVAQNTLQQFIRYNLDTAKAVELATAAQDAAVIAGTDSSDMLQRLIYGISRFDTMILRTGGINIPSATEAFEKFAAANNLSADALTNNQKQAAFLDAVLEESARNAGVYAAAMESPGKQLRSLSRHTYELMRVMGAPFLGAFGQVVKMMTNVTKSFRTAIDEGGPLHDMFLRAGAVALLFAEQIRGAVENGVSFLIEGLATIPEVFNSFIEFITGLATESFDWGSNIITNLAKGMFAAANAVLDALMYIGSLITAWLIPGSPPKLLPKLDKWGAAAATEWVKGWGQADFSTFNDLAKSVEGFLKTLNIKEKDVIPTILGSRKAIAEAINMVHDAGMVTDEALDKIMNSVKKLPASFRDYAKSLLEVEAANSALQEASNTYNAAQAITLDNADEIIDMFSGDLKNSAIDYIDSLGYAAEVSQELADAQAYLNTITSEYDSILAALNDELNSMSDTGDNQRLQEINDAIATGLLTQDELASLQAEKRQIELKKQIAEVEKQKKAEISAAEQRIDILKEVQDAAVQQADIMRTAMLEIAAIQVQSAQAQQDALKEQLDTQKALIGFQTEQNDLVRQQLDLLKRLAEAAAAGGAGAPGLGEGVPAGGGFDIESIKDEMQEKIEEMKEGFKTSIHDFFIGLGSRISSFIKGIPLYEEFRKKFNQVKATWGETFQTLVNWLQINIPRAIAFFSNVWNTKIVPAFQNLRNWVLSYVVPAFQTIWNWLSEKIPPAIQAMSDFWNNTLAPVLQGIFGFLVEHGAEIAAFVAGILAVTGGFVALMSAGSALAGVIATVMGVIEGAAALIVAFTSPIGLVAVAVGLLAAAWTGNWFGIRDTLIDVWTNNVQPVLQKLWDWLSVNVPAAIETLRGWWEGTLLPALQNVWNWVTGTLFPMFSDFWGWLSTKLTAAIETLRSWWEDTLMPAFETAWDWLSGTLFPFFESFANLLEVIFVKAVTTLKDTFEDYWNNTLVPFYNFLAETFKPIWEDIQEVFGDIWDFVSENIVPLFSDLADIVMVNLYNKIHNVWDFLENTLFGTFQTLRDDYLATLVEAFEGITTVIEKLTGWFDKLAAAILGIPQPDPLYIPHSPTPFEQGLEGIREQMQAMYNRDLPKFAAQLRNLPSIGSIPSIPSAMQGNNGNTTINNKNIQLEVNANYAKQQSKASVYYDVSAALMYV